MDIQVEWFKDQFNIHLSSKEGAEPFMTVKGCRIVEGSKGAFISYPARKQENGKYWSHVWGSERFNAEVMRKAAQSQPRQEQKKPSRNESADSDIPFSNPLRGAKGIAL